MADYTYYGFLSNDIESIANRLSKLLLIDWRAQESLYLGGDYYRYGKPDSEEFILHPNYDLLDEEAIYPEYGECKLLLEINRSERASEINKIILSEFGDDVIMLTHL